MIITKDNNTKENWSILLYEYRESRDLARTMVMPSVKVMRKVTLDEDPPAVIAGKERAAQRARELETLKQQHPNLIKMLQYVDRYKLTYKRLDSYHHRIENTRTGQFVDWWDGKNKRMRSVKGLYCKQGLNQSFLLQEIAKLSGGSN